MPGRLKIVCALAALALSVAALVGCEGDTDTTVAPQPDEGVVGSQILEGEALVADRCTPCHDLERVESAGYDAVGWEATVDRMIEKGTTLTDEEKAAVIAYLSTL